MSTTPNFTNPDSPNPDITAEAVRNMFMQGQQPTGGYGTSGYYPGAGSNPFACSQNVTSVPSAESRANVGAYPAAPYPYSNYPQPSVAPPWNPNMYPTSNGYDQLTQINQRALAAQMGYPQQPVSGYNGYPIGVDPNNYIFEYMRTHTAPKNSWGENYWTAHRPVDQPQIDWAHQTPQYDAYAQYGMFPQGQPNTCYPPNLTFPPRQEEWIDIAKKNWLNKL